MTSTWLWIRRVFFRRGSDWAVWMMNHLPHRGGLPQLQGTHRNYREIWLWLPVLYLAFYLKKKKISLSVLISPCVSLQKQRIFSEEKCLTLKKKTMPSAKPPSFEFTHHLCGFKCVRTHQDQGSEMHLGSRSWLAWPPPPPFAVCFCNIC